MSSPPVTHTAEIQISFNELPPLSWQAFIAHGAHSEIYEQERCKQIAALNHAIAERQHQVHSIVKRHDLD